MQGESYRGRGTSMEIDRSQGRGSGSHNERRSRSRGRGSYNQRCAPGVTKVKVKLQKKFMSKFDMLANVSND